MCVVKCFNRVVHKTKQVLMAIYKFSSSPEKYARKIGVHIGMNCHISTREWSSEPYLIYIGNNVQVTHGVIINTHGGGNVVRRKIPDFDIFGKVVIDDGAYIGACSQIMPGVRIGKNSLVAAGSIVTKSVPDGVIVGGNPAKIIGTVEDFMQRNSKYNVHTYGLTYEKKKKFLMALSEDRFISKAKMT